MKAGILGALIGFSLAASAGATAKIDQRKDCQDAAYQAVYDQYQKDSGYSKKEMDQLANIEDGTVEKGQAANTLDVRINSNDIMVWDGYADYLVTLKVATKSCQAIKALLTESEGI